MWVVRIDWESPLGHFSPTHPNTYSQQILSDFPTKINATQSVCLGWVKITWKEVISTAFSPDLFSYLPHESAVTAKRFSCIFHVTKCTRTRCLSTRWMGLAAVIISLVVTFIDQRNRRVHFVNAKDINCCLISLSSIQNKEKKAKFLSLDRF